MFVDTLDLEVQTDLENIKSTDSCSVDEKPEERRMFVDTLDLEVQTDLENIKSTDSCSVDQAYEKYVRIHNWVQSNVSIADTGGLLGKRQKNLLIVTRVSRHTNLQSANL